MTKSAKSAINITLMVSPEEIDVLCSFAKETLPWGAKLSYWAWEEDIAAIPNCFVEVGLNPEGSHLATRVRTNLLPCYPPSDPQRIRFYEDYCTPWILDNGATFAVPELFDNQELLKTLTARLAIATCFLNHLPAQLEKYPKLQGKLPLELTDFINCYLHRPQIITDYLQETFAIKIDQLALQPLNFDQLWHYPQTIHQRLSNNLRRLVVPA